MKIVCLGYDCCMRTILTKCGYKPSKKNGELSMPFDLTIHPYESVCAYLKNDFSNYFDGITWKYHYCPIREKNVQIMVNEKDVYFVHESHIQNKEQTPTFESDVWTVDPHEVDFNANNKILLKHRYFQRIANFYNIISSGEPILFTISTHVDIDITHLNIILKEKFPNLDFQIYCLRIYSANEEHLTFKKICIDNMTISSCKLTQEGFWNSHEQNTSIVENVLKEDLKFTII